MNAFIRRWIFLLVVPAVLLAVPSMHAEPAAAEDDEAILHKAGLPAEGPALLAFFHARARIDVDGDHLRQLLARFLADAPAPRAAATAELLGLGSLALQALRQTANDLEHPEAAERAVRCLPWLEGPSSRQLLIAAAHLLAQRKPAGAAEALLTYLPFADRPEVVNAIHAALAAVAAPAGRADASLLRGLSDRMGVRRAAAGVALCKAVPPEKVPDVRKLLKDPTPAVRLRTALALAESNDADAIPVLIDALADLSEDERKPIEECLTGFAGEWTPILQFATDDGVSRTIRRDAWASWWRTTDGPRLLALLAQHTLTEDKRRKVQELVAQLGSDDFTRREAAMRQLHTFGRLAMPRLRQALKDRDAEVARRAKVLLDRLETGPDVRLPLAALRLLAVRKPAGAAEALLAYLPFADDELREEQVRQSLTVLVRSDERTATLLRRYLGDAQPKVRLLAAQVLIQAAGGKDEPAIRKLLAEGEPAIRMQLALALIDAGERDGVAALIDVLPLLSDELFSQAEDALYQLVGGTAPRMPEGEKAADKKKHRDAWAAWWKGNSQRVRFNRLNARALLGYTLICDQNRLLEVDRQGKMLWSIEDAGAPIDAVMLPNQHVLIAEWGTKRVTERDRKGSVLWEKSGLSSAPTNVQRLPNGNTFIALNQDSVLEVDRTGKELYRLKDVAGLLGAYRSRQGAIVCVTNANQCVFLDTSGKKLRSFAVKHPLSNAGCLDVLPDGRVLIASNNGMIMEYDGKGTLLHEWESASVTTPSGLPNGHVLASSQSVNHVVELTRTGKIVWQQEKINAYRARRR